MENPSWREGETCKNDNPTFCALEYFSAKVFITETLIYQEEGNSSTFFCSLYKSLPTPPWSTLQCRGTCRLCACLQSSPFVVHINKVSRMLEIQMTEYRRIYIISPTNFKSIKKNTCLVFHGFRWFGLFIANKQMQMLASRHSSCTVHPKLVMSVGLV